MVQLFTDDALAEGDASPESEDAVRAEAVKCPDCDHLLGKVTPTPGTRVSFQCRRCRRLVWYVVPPLRVLEAIIRQARTA